jgi:hypothetical protein
MEQSGLFTARCPGPVAILRAVRASSLYGSLGLLAIAAATSRAQTAGLRARILDSTRVAVDGAEVSIPALKRVERSDSSGAVFIGNLPEGKLEIAVRHLNFFPERFFVEVRNQEIVSVEVELSGRSTQLAGVSVTASRHPFFQGFDQRKARGIGTFITRDQIDDRNTSKSSDLFRTMPSVRLVRAGSGMGIRFPQSGMVRRGPAFCAPLIWVDGQQAPGLEIDDLLATDIHAIEIYRGPATTPAQFATNGSTPCGTVVVWTRRKDR